MGRSKNRRYVPIITGLVFIAGGVSHCLRFQNVVAFLVAGIGLMFGLPSLKFGLFASPQAIREMTEPGPVSKSTDREYPDYL